MRHLLRLFECHTIRFCRRRTIWVSVESPAVTYSLSHCADAFPELSRCEAGEKDGDASSAFSLLVDERAR